MDSPPVLQSLDLATEVAESPQEGIAELRRPVDSYLLQVQARVEHQDALHYFNESGPTGTTDCQGLRSPRG